MAADTIISSSPWAAVPFHFWSVVFFIFGCVVGSFLNVCIHRMPRELSVVSPPSHCPNCQYAIPFYLNIPLFTWVALRGRCKNCRAPISFRYFLVELLTGVAFLNAWLRFGNPGDSLSSLPLALVYSLFLAGLIVATFIDFEHFIIPDEITMGGAAVGFALSLFLPELHGTTATGESLVRSALGIVLGGGMVYAVLRMGKLLFGRQRLMLEPGTKIYFGETALILGNKEIPWEEIFYRKTDQIRLEARRVELIDRGYTKASIRLSPLMLEIDDEQIDPLGVGHLEAEGDEITLPREAMGLGDVKFMAGIGAFVGWQGALFSLMVSALIGAILGVVLIALGRRDWSSRMPYGPYIALAAVLWLFAGPQIIAAIFAQ